MQRIPLAQRMRPTTLDEVMGQTTLMKDLGYGKDYKWKADFKHIKAFLPDELNEQIFFKLEQQNYSFKSAASTPFVQPNPSCNGYSPPPPS